MYKRQLLSRCYGRKDFAGIYAVVRYAIISMLAISALVYTAIYFGAEQITGLFNSENSVELRAIAAQGLRLYFMAAPFAGFNIILSIYFTSIERPQPAQAISLLRGFIVILPMALFLSWSYHIQGVWCSFPATRCV